MSIVNAPLSSQPLRYSFPTIPCVTAANGTPVYLIPREGNDLLTITLAMHTGAVHDVIAGETSFTAELLNRGTERLTALAFAEEIEQRGCSIRSGADRDSASIVAAGLSQYGADLVALLAECILTPRFDPEEIAVQCQNRIADIQVNSASPDWLAGRAAASVMWPGHPYARPREGTVATNPTITPDVLRGVHRRMLSARRCIIVAGGFDPAAMLQLLDTHLAGLPAIQGEPAVAMAHMHPRVAAIARKDDAVQTGLRIALPCVPYDHPDYSALRLVTEVLGGYQMARLFTVLRETKGYTYGAYAYADVRRFGNVLSMSTSVGNQFTKDTVATIAEELDRLRTSAIPADELDNAKQSILGQFVRSTETPQQAGALLWQTILHELPQDFYTHHVERLQALDTDSVRDVQERYFRAGNWSIGASGAWDVVSEAVQPFVDQIIPADIEAA